MTEENKDTNVDTKKDDGTSVDSGNEVTPQWKKLGYDTEEEFVDKALEWKGKAEEVDSLKETRDKQATDFRRQSTEVGDLKKENKTLRESKKNTETQGLKKTEDEDDPSKTPEEILDGLDETELKAVDEFLDKPENAELKAKVDAGGEDAMAECVQSYKQSAPRDLSKPLFQSWRQKQTQSSSYDQSSISGMVKTAFQEVDNETKKTIPASERGGMETSEGNEQQKTKPVIGGVDADFFRAQKQ